jgi:hypothetical protein
MDNETEEETKMPPPIIPVESCRPPEDEAGTSIVKFKIVGVVLVELLLIELWAITESIGVGIAVAGIVI